MNSLKSLFVLIVLCTGLVNAQIPEGKKVISSLYVYDLASRTSQLVLREHRHFEAPNWTLDGQYFLINSNGTLEKISIDGSQKEMLPTASVNRANNDHGFSFDGTTLFISSADPSIKEHTSFIYQVNAQGGIPKLITPKTPSYWHGVSPNGKEIVYCAERNGNFDVYKMNLRKGKEIRLTTAEGLDDGPEYAPDGSYIYINSFRTGSMQVWRMKPDGSRAEQMTSDSYSNWFPHINPDGTTAVIISYVEDQGQSHPFGRMVKLRLLDLKTKKLQDLTPAFYGGQGTINVNSWNPTGTKFAYVRYELEAIN